MGWFHCDDDKYVSKEDNIKLKEEKYENTTKYQKIIEDGNYHDTIIGYRDADGYYIEGGHNGNLTKNEKQQFGSDFDRQLSLGRSRR